MEVPDPCGGQISPGTKICRPPTSAWPNLGREAINKNDRSAFLVLLATSLSTTQCERVGGHREPGKRTGTHSQIEKEGALHFAFIRVFHFDRHYWPYGSSL